MNGYADLLQATQNPWVLFGFLSGFLSVAVFLRYVLIAGGFYVLIWKWTPGFARKIEKATPPPETLRYEFAWSALSSLIFGVFGSAGFILWEKGFTRVYLDWNQYGALYPWFSLALLMFLHDAYFYWVHRLMHVPKIFRRIHRVHHESKNPSPWAAFSFHWAEAILEAAILPALILIVPVHPAILVIFLTTMTFLGVINHLGYEIYPRWFFRMPGNRFLISASNHHLHHSRVRYNYGLYFTWWDYWFGTHDSQDSAKLKS
ncbi:MAG: sterol desaturase family protein [Bdellovibrionales bacterium]|nr:sterol desaturase family protein [Bdellovibrionales bacterium]